MRSFPRATWGWTGLWLAACAGTPARGAVDLLPSDAGSCGRLGAACCNGTACNDGLFCGAGVCVGECGGRGEACCDGTACNDGLECTEQVCASIGAGAADGGAIAGVDGGPCGASGQVCCPGNACLPNGELICVFNECVIDDNWTHWVGNPPDVPPDSQYIVASDGLTAMDSVTGLLWQLDATTSTPSAGGEAASGHCDGLDLGGYSSGWRLPTLVEGISIMNISGCCLTPASMVFSQDSGALWTLDRSGSSYWSLDLAGNTYSDYEVDGQSSATLCVRSPDLPGVPGTGPGAPPGRYTISEGGTPDGTVYDVVTRLTWQQAAANGSYTWSSSSAPGSAQAYCAQLTVGGFSSGWRVPSAKELASIVDVETLNPSIDLAFLTTGPLSPTIFWTSSEYMTGTVNGVSIDFSDGTMSSSSFPLTSGFNVRCVR